jgi:tetratricopeptide (TPR) repeat protein
MRACRTLLVSVLLLTICFALGCERNQLNRGLQFELQGNYATALQSYRQVLDHVPPKSKSRAEVLDRIGECLVRLNRPQDAYTAFQQAVEVDPNDITARLRIGQMLLEAGAPSRAREQANLILRTTPTNIEALELLGAAWSTSGHFDLAKAAYTRVLERDPTRVKVAIALADIYNREDNAPRAERILKDAANSHPGDAMPWLALARLHEEQGDGHQAEAAYRKAVAVSDTPETNMRLAQFLQRSSRILEAEQALRRVDAEQPSEPVALADFQLLSGRPGKAAQGYANALASTQSLPRLHTRWSLPFAGKFRSDSNHNQQDVAARMVEAELAKASRVQGGQRKQAMASVRTLLTENRRRFDDATAEILECEIALAEDNLASAKLLAANALKLAPTSAAAHYVAGLVASADGDDDTAQTEWQEALNQDPHFSPARLAVAQDALAHHDPETADENARSVVRQAPGDLQATLVFSRALLMEGKPLAAAIMAQRANALDPSSPEPSLILGDVAVKIHNRTQALLHFERALALRPDCEEAMQGLLKLYDVRHLSHADIQKIEHVAQEPPVSSTLLEIAGRLYAERGWRDDAIRVLQHTVEMDPKRITAARFLARLQLASGDFAGATQSAMKAGIDAQALLTAYSDQSAGNWQKAVDTYEQALRDGDQTGVAANNVAWLYAEHGVHLDRALSLAQTAAHQSPNNPAILDTLALVHLRRREYTDAVKLLETAAHLSAMLPHDSANRDLGEQIRKHLSEAYLRAGQTKEAMRIAQQRNPFSMQ